jgi:transglutaminase-like putative cysteine protease
MPRLRIRHVTVYRYARPVTLGEHRMMFRPRDSHDLKLLDTHLAISPAPSRLRWLHDVMGNSVAIAEFDASTDELRFESEIEVEHFDSSSPEFPVEQYALYFPFSYASEELPDLGRSIERGAPDPEHRVDQWARSFLDTHGEGSPRTLDILARITHAIHANFHYGMRHEEGVQLPADTINRGAGSCRDFAFLMMEAVRSLGLAARFVSGYLYSPDLDGGGHVGGGATHAWVQVYLPGTGWIEFDPTNGIVGNRDLIRVAVARDPRQAVPLTGSWTGLPGDYLGMDVDVSVTQL